MCMREFVYMLNRKMKDRYIQERERERDEENKVYKKCY